MMRPLNLIDTLFLLTPAITVGAYGPDGTFASFSNRGTGIDILAPGVDILSLGSDDVGGGLKVMSGTSMSAGHVSGAAALFLDENPNATPAQVIEALLSTAQTTVTGVPSNTTNKSVWVGVGGALDAEIPPFFDYAVHSANMLKFEDTVTILPSPSNPSSNANVFAKELAEGRQGSSSYVGGFGYYTNKVSNELAGVFQPRINPTQLAPTQLVPPNPIDEDAIRDMEGYRYLATRTTDDDLELSGTVQLGTAENPVVWYVDGKLKIDEDAPVRFNGHGIFLVRDGIEFKTRALTNENTQVAFFTDKKIKIESPLTELRGTFFSWEDIELRGGVQIDGSLVALGDIVLKDGVRIRHEPIAASLARVLWSN